MSKRKLTILKLPSEHNLLWQVIVFVESAEAGHGIWNADLWIESNQPEKKEHCESVIDAVEEYVNDLDGDRDLTDELTAEVNVSWIGFRFCMNVKNL